MPRGRKPKPPEVRELEGNPGHRAIPERVSVGGPPPKDEMMEPPEHLPDDAKDWWVYSVDKLYAVGLIDTIDIPVLEQLAMQYARIRAAQRAIAIHGHFFRSANGNIRPHPAVKLEREATVLFLKMAEHYALTPVARVRLGLAELQRKSMKQEMDERLGATSLEPV